ncbi:MAG: alpha/beta hydrolase, partial [Bacteroidales bacterium]|nr:alpha/beta hydrolase [Bacteroidales bacterium]
MLQSKYLREEKKQVWYELKWQTPDGQELFAQCWDAGENAKAGILLVHGIGEHSSRYDKWANYLNREGFSVLSFDLRGHGKTPGQKGTFANYTKLLEDLDLLLEQGKKLCSEKPLFLYGHSFGGNLVANYAIRNQLTVQGIILTSPWFELSFTPPRHKLIAASILSRFAPRITSPNGLKP